MAGERLSGDELSINASQSTIIVDGLGADIGVASGVAGGGNTGGAAATSSAANGDVAFTTARPVQPEHSAQYAIAVPMI